MSTVVIGIFAEGRSDERFLPLLTQRTIEKILCEKSNKVFDVLEPFIINVKAKGIDRIEKIKVAASSSCGYNILVIHSDSDSPDYNLAYQERILPGIQAIQAEEQVCKDTVSCIPVYMTETWLLADYDVLLDEFGTNLSPTDLDLPNRISQLERINEPKTKLREMVNIVFQDNPKRKKRFNINDIYNPIAQRISIDKLRQLPSFARFEEDLTNKLRELHFIE